MAIKDVSGERSTPKLKAAEILLDAVATSVGYWAETWRRNEGMTTREEELVHEQMRKLGDRLARLLGYEGVPPC